MGAGAVGTLLGGLLAAAGHEVTLVDGRVAPDAPADLVISRPHGRRTRARVARAARPLDVPGPPPDAVLLAVKMFDVRAALDDLAGWPAVPLLTVQNGIGAEEYAAAARPGGAVVAASLTSPVERPGPAEVRWRGRGGIGLAVAAGAAAATADWLAASFEEAGLPARRFADARAMKWSKLLANLVGNALSALADRDPPQVYADPVLFDLERRQLLEALAVMRAARLAVVGLPGADVRLLALAVRLPAPLSRPLLRRVVAGARGGKQPSLRQHLRSGTGPTEGAWLNGAVARAGQTEGVPTPVNTVLARLLDQVVADPNLRQELAARPHRIAELVAAERAPASLMRHP
jgi:2-dehydropantoate 2-reductase